MINNNIIYLLYGSWYIIRILHRKQTHLKRKCVTQTFHFLLFTISKIPQIT